MPEPNPDQVFDIQHDVDPAQDHGLAKRIPHLGHAVLFLSLSVMVISLCALAVSALLHIRTEADELQHIGAGITVQALGYAITLAISAWLFSALWAKPFLVGIEWNSLSLRRFWIRLVPLGVLLCVAANELNNFLPKPKKVLLDSVFDSRIHAWELTAFGILLAPLFEEVVFRGFLLPAFATAYDWLALERTPAGIRQWETTASHTRGALIFASVFSSIGFAALHASQLSFAWGPVLVLFCVSLVFSHVRVRTHSLASTVLMHAVYNATEFVAAIYTTGFYRHLDKLH